MFGGSRSGDEVSGPVHGTLPPLFRGLGPDLHPSSLAIPGGSEVYVVKDDAAARQALTSRLTAAGFASRAFDSGAAFLAVSDRLPPGCVITSLQTQGMEAAEFLRRLGEQRVTFPAIIVTSRDEILRAVQAMTAGAVTMLERPYDDDVLLGAVRAALEVEAPAATQARRTGLSTLTRREHEVLRGVIDGQTNKMIARRLAISPRTVEVYRASVMKKTGAGSVPELVRLVVGAVRLPALDWPDARAPSRDGRRDRSADRNIQ